MYWDFHTLIPVFMDDFQHCFTTFDLLKSVIDILSEEADVSLVADSFPDICNDDDPDEMQTKWFIISVCVCVCV